jgi:hypothetical protein
MFLAHLTGVTSTNIDKLFGEFGIMSSTAQRSRMLLHLGWIDHDTFHDISIFGKIRNRFAHRYDIDTFSHREISGLVSSIKTDARTPLFAALNVMKNKPPPDDTSHASHRWLSSEEVDKVINEFQTRAKLFVIVCFAFLILHVFLQMTYAPIAQRFRVSLASLLNREREVMDKKHTASWIVIGAILRFVGDMEAMRL